MTSFEICTFEDFIAEATPQSGSLEEAASTQEILIQQLEGYLNRMREAVCRDVETLRALIPANGGGGGLPDLVAGVEVSSGREVLGSPSFFKLIDTGALPNIATTTTGHGIASPFRIISAYGSAKNPSTNDHRPLPFAIHPAGSNGGIAVIIDGTNVSIFTAFNYSAWTSSHIILEYIKVA